jgi:hypothetical protein
MNPIYLIALIMLVAGAFGGGANYLLNRSTTIESVDKRPTLCANLFLGIVAALTVPLFLELAQSSLVGVILSGWQTKPETLFVFFGFCVVAAVSSRAFLQSISKQLLSSVQEA